MAENTLRFIKLDYQAHRDAILQRVRARWPGVWNDFLFTGNASFGTVLVDIAAWSAATLAWVVNKVAAENFISTMTLRESAQRIGSLVGYKLRGASPASVLCEAELSQAQDADLTINQGTVIRTGSDVVFEVSQDYTIEAGNLTPVIPVITLSATETGASVLATNVKVTNSSTVVDLADTTIDISEYVASNQSIQFGDDSTTYTIGSISSQSDSGVPNRFILTEAYTGSTAIVSASIFEDRITLTQGQTVADRFVSPTVETAGYLLKLSRDEVIDGSTSVTVDGTSWTEVDTLYDQLATAQVYVVKTLTNGQTVIEFGDGTFGETIPAEARIVVSYRVGGGTIGNISRGEINTTISGFLTTTLGPVTILIQNSSAEGQGGQDPETVEQARSNIPAYTRTNDRAVTLSDYQTLAGRFSGENGSVAYARVSPSTENALLEGNIVRVYAWTRGAGQGLVNLDAPLKTELQEYLQTKAVGTDYVMIADGSARPVPISLRFKTLSGYDTDTVEATVNSTITTFINDLVPGSTIIWSDFVRMIDETEGVDKCYFATPTSDVAPANQTELFTPLDDTFDYTVDRTFSTTESSDDDGVTVAKYTAQLPISPLTAWAFEIYIGGQKLSVFQDTQVGYARLYRNGVLSVSDSYKSRVELSSGVMTIWTTGTVGDITMRVRGVQVFDTERTINVYVGFSGVTTQARRREIRQAIRNWAEGLEIGGALYGTEISGVTGSKSNIKDVVLGITGVTGVSRVALETPNSSAVKIDASTTELIRLGQIVLNNATD